MNDDWQWSSERPKEPGYFWAFNGYTTEIAHVYYAADGERLMVSTMTPPIGDATMPLAATRREMQWALISTQGPTPDKRETQEDLRAYVDDLATMTIRAGEPGEAIAAIVDENQRVIEARGGSTSAAVRALNRLIRERPKK